MRLVEIGVEYLRLYRARQFSHSLYAVRLTMPDPLTLATVGSSLLTEGIKFLYKQAGEALKHWREGRNEASKRTVDQVERVSSSSIQPPPIFEGQLAPLEINIEMVQRLEGPMRQLRHDLADYVDGTETVDAANLRLVETIDALRRVMEIVYGQRITLKGEQRSPSGPIVASQIEVDEVAGYAAAVRAEHITSGRVNAHAKARRVEPGGEFSGVDAKTIGNKPS
jgi:hypothetical protein